MSAPSDERDRHQLGAHAVARDAAAACEALVCNQLWLNDSLPPAKIQSQAQRELLIKSESGDSRTMGIKLSAKFARQESEEARLARISRKRIPLDRIATIRRMLGLVDPEPQMHERLGEVTVALSCPDCSRTFALPMHLGRHRRASHGPVTQHGINSVRREASGPLT
jgi:hypothetical protein